MKDLNYIITEMTPKVFDYCVKIGLGTHTSRKDYLTYKYLVVDGDEIVGYNDLSDTDDSYSFYSEKDFIRKFIISTVHTRLLK